MSRIRSIHPGLWTDEAFVSLSPFARLLSMGLWNECDDKGTFPWSPIQMKMRLLPADNVDASALMAELEAADLITKYQVGGKSFGAVRNFCKFQRPKKPNDINPITDAIRKYVGLDRSNSGSDEEEVPNQFPTDGEKSPQMEDGGEEEEGDTPPTPQGDGESEIPSFPMKVVEAWNAGPATKGATKALKLDSSRRKQLATRVDEHGEQAVLDAIRGIASSPHHCGNNDRGWKASLSWILESPRNFMKALEMAPPETAPVPEKTPEERQAQCRSMIAFNEKLGRSSEVEEWTRKLIAAGGTPDVPTGSLAFIGPDKQAELQQLLRRH